MLGRSAAAARRAAARNGAARKAGHGFHGRASRTGLAQPPEPRSPAPYQCCAVSAATAVTACQWPLDSDGPDALRSATPGTNFKAKYFHPQGVAAVLDRNSAADPNVGKHIPFFHLLNSAAALLLCFTSGDHSKGGKLDLIDLKKNHELQKWQEKFKTNSRNKREKSRNLPLSSY